MADVDWGVRCTACEALHDLGLYGNAPTALSPRLVRLALEDPNFIVRSRASQALRFYRSPDVILALRQVQAHDHESDEEYMVEAASAMAGESLRHIESAENSGG
jgi:HEAT repeat protein